MLDCCGSSISIDLQDHETKKHCRWDEELWYSFAFKTETHLRLSWTSFWNECPTVFKLSSVQTSSVQTFPQCATSKDKETFTNGTSQRPSPCCSGDLSRVGKEGILTMGGPRRASFDILRWISVGNLLNWWMTWAIEKVRQRRSGCQHDPLFGRSKESRVNGQERMM